MRPSLTGLFRRTVVLTSCALLFASCTSDNSPTQPAIRSLYTTPTGMLTANPPQIFIGAGDISSCSNNGDEQTAQIIDTIPGTVYNLGDDAYNNGTTSEFKNCYDPTWGRFKSRTHPSPGNHEYNTSGAAPYYAYFGAAAGDPSKGYYSYDLGAWHVIVLNSNISHSKGSAQDTWLLNDLATHSNVCTLAYFHHPLYSSTSGTGTGGTTYSSSRRYWDDFYPAGVDLVLGGHRHFYERLAPMKPDGTPDNTYGIREIIAGTGGIGGGTMTNIFPTSEVRNGDTRGVLKLYLYDDSYAWRFIPIAGKTFTDSGSTACHGAPGSATTPTVSASNSTVTASPTSIAAGTATSTITVTAKDASGNPISGATVVLSSTGTGNTLGQPSATTNSSGVATGTISSTMAEAKTVSAKINGVSITQTAGVTVTPASANRLAFIVQPTTTAAGAVISPAVQVEIDDQYGNRVTSATNSVTMGIGTNPSSGTLSGTKTVTAASGVAAFSTLTINKAGTGYTLAATATGLSGASSASFDVTAVSLVSASQSSVAAAPSLIAAGSGSATITVTAMDANGNPVSGVTVSLQASGSGNTLTQPAAATDGNGVATGTLASTTAGDKTVTATADGVVLSQKPVVTVTAGLPDPDHSSVTASPGAITAGSGTTTITVTAKDANDNPVSSASVVLAASGTGNTLTQPGPTDANGVATGTLSSTDVQVETVSATVGGVAVTQTASVAVNAPGAAATITQTLLTSGNNTANQSTYTTVSIAPVPNTLITVAVLSQQSTSAAPSPTLSGGGMTAWDIVGTVTFDSPTTPHQRITIYRAMSASPGSGPITIKFVPNVSHCEWIVSQWDGVDGSGVNGSGAVGQIGSNAANAVNGLSVELAPFGSANNVAMGVFGVVKSTIAVTPGAGFTEIDEQPSAEGSTSASDLEAEWAVNLNTVGATWTNLNGGALAVELKAKTGP